MKSLSFSIDTHDLLSRFVCFLGVGLIGTMTHYLALITLVQFVDWKPVPASMVGFTLGASLNYRITFQSNRCHREAILKFISVASIGLLLNSLILGLAVNYFNLYYLLAQVIATGLVLIWNFAAHRAWTF